MPLPTHFNKKDIVLCALLGAFCLYIFNDIVIEGHRLIGIDFTDFYLGMKAFLFDELHIQHSIPFWNPYIFGGIPFWAHFESTIFYPLGFLFWLIPPDKAYGYTMFIHLILAGIFMYILARSLGFGRAGSFVAATVFTCNGFIMAILHLGQMCPVQSYIWLPLIIFFLNQALASKTPYFSASIAGVLWGIQILAGAPQDAFYTFLASILFLTCSIKYHLRAGRYILRLFAVALLLFVIGAGVASIQIVPAFEFIRESVRAGLDSYGMATLASYPPEGIVTVVMPHFFGGYAKDTFWVSNVPWSVPQQNLYVGILPLILLFFIAYRHSDLKKVLLFAGSLAVIAFVLALGRHTPIYKLVYLLPGFDRFRAPSKIIVLWVFALGLLAGKGMDGLLRNRRTTLTGRLAFCLFLVICLVLLDGLFQFDRSIVLKFFSSFVLDEAIPSKITYATRIISNQFHHLTLFFTLVILAILLWTRGILKPKLGAALLCALLLVDLAIISVGAVQHNDQLYRSMENTRRALNGTIGRDNSEFRVGSYTFGLGPNLEMYLGYQTVGGFTALFPGRYYEYMSHYANQKLPEGWVWFSYGREKDSILMDLLNVKYEIFHATRSYALRKTYLPRAFIVPNYETMRKEEVLNYLIGPDFDPTRTVLFEEDDFKPDIAQHPLPESKTAGQATIISYRPDRIVLSTDSSGPGFLFLSEIFYPGWKAFVDGQPKRILRGNYLFRVVELPEGHHEVRLIFDPLSIKVGIGITIFTLFMILNIMIYHFRKRIPFLNRGQKL